MEGAEGRARLARTVLDFAEELGAMSAAAPSRC